MNSLIKDMEQYAHENDIPIMEVEGIQYLQACIKKYNVNRILEIGSAIGYSTIQMCRVHSNVCVTTLERDETRYKEACKNIEKAGMQTRIEIQLCDALEANIEGVFDMIFIDAAKAQYIKFFERYEKNLSDEGIIISDNLKFHGLVEHPERIKNRNTRALVKKIEKYVDYLENNEVFTTTFVDIGDGVAITQRKKHID